jgi:hypothetical protein
MGQHAVADTATGDHKNYTGEERDPEVSGESQVDSQLLRRNAERNWHPRSHPFTMNP